MNVKNPAFFESKSERISIFVYDRHSPEYNNQLNMDRKEFLKTLGLATAGVAFMGIEVPASAQGDNERVNIAPKPLGAKVSKPVTVCVIGAGNRGRLYARYAERYPETMKVVGVSDINPERAKAMAQKHGIAPEYVMGHYNEVFTKPKFADVLVISTPDDRHYEPCMKGLEMGYDILLEKPAAQTEKECKDILAQTRKYGRIVAICHVLRYAPYFVALRQTAQSGIIGDIVSIQHMEPIEHQHMAHSYVRGNWRVEKDTTPIILAKSCHDLDIIRWIIGKPCERVSADGSLFLFKKENAPEGAPYRCTDGCPHEAKCPYSALRVYVRNKKHLGVFDLKDRNDENEIREKLLTTGYGRCVYHCDNDQPDHYVANMVFDGGTTSSFTMDAFTPWGGRRTRIMGTLGYIEGDMNKFTVYEFASGRKLIWDKEVEQTPEYKGSGHGGGDFALVRDFLEAVDKQDESLLSSTIEASIESHIIGFAAEKSRKGNKKRNVKL